MSAYNLLSLLFFLYTIFFYYKNVDKKFILKKFLKIIKFIFLIFIIASLHAQPLYQFAKKLF